ncbi:MAG: toprim domain-containing protein [Halobacteriota archaeon]|nr:toprim domain-containing protein [Halobacteriota archaeon]
MDPSKRLENVEKVLDELRELAGSGAVIIVEGKRDRQSLMELGVKGQILLATHSPLLSFTDKVSKKCNEAVIMTDWDAHGERLAVRIMEYLQSVGTIPNNKLRLRLKSLVKKEVTAVEDLSRYVEKLRLKTSPQNY